MAKAPRSNSGSSDLKNPRKQPFTPESLDRTRIAIPLLDEMKKDTRNRRRFHVIIDVNLEYPGDRRVARDLLWKIIDSLPGVSPTFDKAKRSALDADEDKAQLINPFKSAYSEQYLFGTLSTRNISKLVLLAKDKEKNGVSPLYRIWLDHDIDRFTNKSVSTVKADAAFVAFNASGHDIIWAVADTGVDKKHRHFDKHKNLDLGAVLHRDFTGLGQGTEKESDDRACTDKRGHGTHVAGIIAGQFKATPENPIKAEVRSRDEKGDIRTDTLDDIKEISGMAPACKILSLKVLDDNGKGRTSNVIAALEYVNELNGNGRRIIVQGVNLSVGYDFEPKWFACGQSPLCIEVNRLVRSGVVVVVAAGNTGYGYNTSAAEGRVAAGQDLTINDPGNADLAITVGATHRDMPHIYGVSYFSSKGPTGDGRLKPDLVAPGEKIISCRSGDAITQADADSDGQGGGAGAAQAPTGPGVFYKEDSGTSMAAPHVSGVIAAFLSARQEFIGRPDAVKEIFMSTATDLKRAVYFQGKGLVDLMRAIQSV